jgi:plasmid stabilization system protein ParE
MNYHLHPDAEVDLREAAEFYRKRAGNELALTFIAEFEYSISLLLEHPTLGAMWRNGRRRFVMRRFPYSLIYNVVDQQIRILAVAHQSRRPGYWKDRN